MPLKLGMYAKNDDGRFIFAQILGVTTKLHRYENGDVFVFCGWRDHARPGGYWRRAGLRSFEKVINFIDTVEA